MRVWVGLGERGWLMGRETAGRGEADPGAERSGGRDGRERTDSRPARRTQRTREASRQQQQQQIQMRARTMQLRDHSHDRCLCLSAIRLQPLSAVHSPSTSLASRRRRHERLGSPIKHKRRQARRQSHKRS